MTFDFRMTQEEYLLGCNYRAGRQSIKNVAGIKSFVFSLATLLVLVLTGADTVLFLLPLILIGFGIFERKSVNAAYAKEYGAKPFLYGVQQITCDENKIKVQNAFEKYSSAYADIFAVRVTKKKIIILFTYRRGVFVINREKYADECEKLLELFAEKGVKLDGKRI